MSTVSEYLTTIKEYLLNQNTQSALELAQLAVQTFPNEAEGYFLCAEAYLQQDNQANKDKIIDYLRQACVLKNDNIKYHGRLAGQLLSVGQLDEAISHYQHIISLQPVAWAYIELGNAFQKKGNIADCIVCFEQALKLEATREGLRSRLNNLQAKHQAPQKQAILILGMHRSGTSVLTRIINLLGADIAHDLMENNFANETGYWESIELAKIHDDILASFNSSWDDILPNTLYLQKENTNYYKTLLNDYLLKTFSQSNFFVIKDPRLCKLIPLWLEVLAQSNIGVKVIIPFRNPLEVAGSLQKRDGFSTEKSFLMWLRHILEVEQHTRGLKRCFINYVQLLNNHQQVIEAITKQCAIQWPYEIESVLNQVNQFIDPSHYHQRIDNEQLMQSSISTWISQAYTVLNKLTQDNHHQASIEQLDNITNALQQADKLYANIIADKNHEFQQLLNTYQALIENHQHNADIQQSINNEIKNFYQRLAELNNSLR
ncbi:MAG: hypothetical protein WAX77_14305 [Methylococcaceae bacterium]